MTETIQIKDGDWVFSGATGRPVTTSGRAKLTQDTRQNLDMEVQENGTGAALDLVIGQVGDIFSLRSQISRQVNEAFSSYQQIQDSVQRFDRTDEETLDRVVQVVVVPLRTPGTNQVSFTSFAIRLDVLSEAGPAPITLTSILTQ